MASLSFSPSLSSSLPLHSSSLPSTSFTTTAASNQFGIHSSPIACFGLYGAPRITGSDRRRRGQVVRMAPEDEKMTRRSPLDFPIEWERPKPGRRPDIFPQFSPMKSPLPPPMPADPPEEDEDEEEEKEEEEEEETEKEDRPENPE
ncbi:hypothetical protein V2J09_005460 [Rumex salicifolius]